MKVEKKYQIFLAVLSIAGSLLVYLATSHYGPGLSTDGARYLSTAESIVQGRGIVDYLGLPLINWPPLYSILLAGISWFTKADVFVLGQFINVLAFGAIIWLSGILFERSLPKNYTFATLASLVIAFSLPLIEVSANIASDPLFMVCVLLFLLVGQAYVATRKRSSWWQMVLLAVAACFLRYAGLALVMCGALTIFVTWRKELRRAFLEAAGFGLASGLPIAAWALFHNYRLTGSILGAHLPSYPWGLFVAAVDKFFSWFVPESLLNFVPPLALAGLLLALLAWRSNRKRWKAWLARILAAPVLPSTTFFLVYGLMLIFAISYPEHRVAGSQRIHAVLLPMLLVLAAVSAQELLPKLPRKPKVWRNMLLASFALWMLFPLYRVAVYVRSSSQNGDISYYNLYNTGTLRESDIVKHIQELQFGEDERVYSNNEGAAWFYLRRRIYRLPRFDPELGQDLGEVMRSFDAWPPSDENATLIWFKRDLDYKETVPTPEQMAEFIRLIQSWTGRYGTVYLMDVDLGQ